MGGLDEPSAELLSLQLSSFHLKFFGRSVPILIGTRCSPWGISLALVVSSVPSLQASADLLMGHRDPKELVFMWFKDRCEAEVLFLSLTVS